MGLNIGSPVVRTDGLRTGGRAVYGHVITKFSGMGRFTYPWCSAGALRAPELRYHPSRALHSSSKNLLEKPAFDLKTYGGCSCAAVAAPSLWNSLPDDNYKDLQNGEQF